MSSVMSKEGIGRVSSRRQDVERGIIAGVTAGGLVTVLLLAIAIPTNEFRARIWFLLAGTRDYTLHAAIFGAFALAGLLVLALLRSWTAPSLFGMLAGAGLQLAVLSAGIYQWIPETRPILARVTLCAVTLTLVSAIIWRQRRHRSRTGTGKPADAAAFGGVGAEGLHTPPTVPWRRDRDSTA